MGDCQSGLEKEVLKRVKVSVLSLTSSSIVLMQFLHDFKLALLTVKCLQFTFK